MKEHEKGIGVRLARSTGGTAVPHEQTDVRGKMAEGLQTDPAMWNLEGGVMSTLFGLCGSR